MNYLMWGGIGFIFNKYIRGRYRGWWSNYNYVLSASLDAGLALSTIVIFFALTMTKTEAPKWWGNNVVTSTLVSLIFLSLFEVKRWRGLGEDFDVVGRLLILLTVG
jgi:hypothetical protein